MPRGYSRRAIRRVRDCELDAHILRVCRRTDSRDPRFECAPWISTEGPCYTAVGSGRRRNRAAFECCRIGVGLHPGYKQAQKLYAKRGYIPDGRGVTYCDRYVEEGASVVLDDDLVLHLTKRLTQQPVREEASS